MDPVDRQLHADALHRLRDQGALDDDAFTAALAHLRPDAGEWLRTGSRTLTVFGAVAIGAGVLYFVGWNWTLLPRLVRFGLVEGLFVAAIAFAVLFGLDRLASKAALGVATLILGALFVLVGQTYPTGADAWTLFAVWAVLALPLVAAARVPALWVLEVLLVQAAVALYVELVLQPVEPSEHALVALAVAVVGALGWGAFEGLWGPVSWLQERWAPPTLLATVLLPLALAAASWVVEEEGVALASAIAWPPLLLVIAGAIFVGLRLRPDRTTLALVGLAVLVETTALLGRGIYELGNLSSSQDVVWWAFLFVVAGVLVVAEVGLLGLALWVAPRFMREEEQG